jgi:hypothetical protein
MGKLQLKLIWTDANGVKHLGQPIGQQMPMQQNMPQQAMPQQAMPMQQAPMQQPSIGTSLRGAVSEGVVLCRSVMQAQPQQAMQGMGQPMS